MFRRTSSRKASDVCKHLADDMKSLSACGEASAEQALQIRSSVSADVQKHLADIFEVFKDVVEGSSPGDAVASDVEELLTEFLSADLPALMVGNMVQLEFEVRKNVIRLFSVLLRLNHMPSADHQVLEYVRTHPSFFSLLIDGYANHEIATHCGMMLRSCARRQQLVEVFWSTPDFVHRLHRYTRHESFDISSDAFSTLHDFLLIHKEQSSTHLDENFLEFFTQYNALLQGDDYVTQRQALKLLSEILLDLCFQKVMLRYIGDEHFLQIHMNLLRGDSKAMQFEAFHVFKIFVANPQKPPRIAQILFKNKERLVNRLEAIKANKPDKNFAEDMKTVIEKLQLLELPSKPSVERERPQETDAA